MSTLVGSIVAYACVANQASPPPDGWLLCDGRAVSRSTYDDLFAVIGTLHGGGDGVNTFNLPDYRGRFLRGVDDGTGRDPDAATRSGAAVGGATGDKVGSVQSDATAPPSGTGTGFVLSKAGDHRHSVSHLPTDNSWYEVHGDHYAKWTDGSSSSTTAGKHQHTVTGGGDRETTPKSIYIHYLIACGRTAS